MPETWKECEGQVIDGRFSLIEHVGGSDHSVVFRTQRGKDSSEKAAIKFVQADPANAEAQLKRWKQAAQFSHPNLIKLFESGRCQMAGMDLLYVVMEFASENLAEFLPQRALSPSETRDMLEPFIDTLTYLHGKGVVHGNIKPGNILAIDDQLKLSSDSIRRVGEGPLGGAKPDAYTAPEAANGEYSAPADVWALGVTLVEALTQRTPELRAGDPAAQVADSVPQPFQDIASHSLQGKPNERWTIAEISAKLNPKAAASAPLPASTQNLPEVAKPAAPSQTGTGASKDATKAAAAAPKKPAAAIDPLSIPLSRVEPPPGEKRHALDHQVISGQQAPARGYYLVVAVILALTIGGMLAIPRFRGHQTEAQSTIASEPSQPEPQSVTTTAPVTITPPAPPISQPKAQAPAEQKPAAAPQTKPAAAQASVQASVPKQSKGELSAANTSPASLKSAVSAAPFVPDREASIKAGAVTPGEVLNQILPDVSSKSRSTIRGTVRTVIKVRVDTAGSVSSAEIASGGSRFFAVAALDAAKQWDFAPAKVDGHAVPSEWLLHFDFTPSDTKVTSLPTKP